MKKTLISLMIVVTMACAGDKKPKPPTTAELVQRIEELEQGAEAQYILNGILVKKIVELEDRIDALEHRRNRAE